MECSTVVWHLTGFLTDCRLSPGNVYQLQYVSNVGNFMAADIFSKKLLYKKLVLNFLTKYNNNTISYCSHNSREQMKNSENFSNEGQP